jgi:hypothetical protein
MKAADELVEQVSRMLAGMWVSGGHLSRPRWRRCGCASEQAYVDQTWQMFSEDAGKLIQAVLKGTRDATPEMIDTGIPVICTGLPATDTSLDQLCFAPDCDCYSKHGLKVTPAAFRAMMDRRIKDFEA